MRRLEMSELKDKLEAMVDRSSVSAVLTALSKICDGRAGHLLTTSRNLRLARGWRRAARAIDRAIRALPSGPGIARSNRPA
jgi:hypothetical protein